MNTQTLSSDPLDSGVRASAHPVLIQGGMGIAVSDWRLARAVSQRGQLGVVSGTALDAVLARRLQLGDEGGHLRRALDAFPCSEMAGRVWDRYYGSTGVNGSFKSRPLHKLDTARAAQELIIIANFVEVFLAKEGHDGLVGINLLEKIQIPTAPSLFGAMLAGVDYVLMGAGIPRAIPGILDQLSRWELVQHRIDVKDAGDETFLAEFDPTGYLPKGSSELKRPYFLPIVSSSVLALSLVRKGSGRIDGFVVEGPTAGGHNAPPRGELQLSERHEPIYGPRDEVDLAKFRELGLPFWLAGGAAKPGRLEEALAEGAQGIQVGTAFALCDESGIEAELKRRVIQEALAGSLDVFTDPLASPTGFPFKVAKVDGSLGCSEVFEARERLCDLGYLRQAYRKDDASVGFRCPAEPAEDFVRKGGDLQETVGRKCVCNGLMASIGLGQHRKDGYKEPPLITTGDDIDCLKRLVKPGENHYTASDVIDMLLARQ
jgi:nitronate monooxygenase